MTPCATYAAFRSSLQKAAGAAAAQGARPNRDSAFNKALAIARYHREHCAACDAEFIDAFPELARSASHNEILSHKIEEEEE